MTIYNQVNSWVCATIPMAGTVTYDCIPEVQIPPQMTLLRAFECLVPSMTKTMQTERKRQRRGQRQRQCKQKEKTKTKTKTNPHTMPVLPAFGCPLTTPHNTNSLSVNSGCHSECLHQNSKSQCQKLSPWFLAGKLNGAWSVTEARKCSEVFEPLGCIASV